MKEWKEYKLSEVYDFASGLSKSRDEFGFGFPFLSFREVFNNFFVPIALSELANTTDKERKRCSIKRGDVFLTRTSESQDELGMSSVALRDYPNATFNGFTKRLRPKSNCILPEYAGYYFRSPKFRATVSNMASLTTRASLNNNMLSDLEIVAPPLPEQKAIAEILSSLDDKIDLLHKQNQRLEELAEVLFRKWFIVDNDPEGAELFLSDVADHHKQSVKPFEEPFQVYHHYSIPAFDDGQNPQLELGDNIRSNKYQVLTNSILISKLNPRFPRVWQVSKPIDEDFSICSTEFQVVVPHDEQMFAFIYYFLKSQPVTDELIGAAGGTSGSHQRVSPEDIFNLSFVKPQDDRLEKFHQIATPNLQKINNNREQILKLEKLRNTLLPKLMSGEVRVKN